MSDKYASLFTPFNIGKEQIKNRLVMGPMGMANPHETDGAYKDKYLDFVVERAKGGWGAIVLGAHIVGNEVDYKISPSMLDNPGHYYMKASELNERCNAYGTKVFAQIGFGVGRSYPGFMSASPNEVYGMPNLMSGEYTKDQIAKKVEAMVKAGALMKQSGYAGVDIHTLHWGYLLDQFVLSITNRREDEYGGCLENRMRVVREIVGGIKQVCGSDFPITIGLGVKYFIKALNKASLTGEEEAGRTVEEAIEIAKMLEAMGVDAIMTDTGCYDSFYYACPPCYMPKGYGMSMYEQVKKAVNIPVLARGRMNDPDLCVEVLEKGLTDAIVMSRQALADPYFPRKLESGKVEKIRPCIGCNMGCIAAVSDTHKDITCAVNPRVQREAVTRPKKSVALKSIAVVGGGVAGMQAAITAAEAGHKVEIFEKSGVLGGELNAAGAHEFKKEIHQLRDWYINELKDLKVPVNMNTEFSADMADGKYDAVILATGASAIMPKSIAGIEKAVSAVELLEKHKATGDKVVVVGAGMVGCETAVELAKQGKRVTLVEALDKILSSGELVPTQHRGMLTDMLEYHGVEIITGHKIAEVKDNAAVIEAVADGARREVSADNVILAIGLAPNKSMASELVGKGVEIYEIGSAKKAGSIINAVHEAFEVAYNFD